MGPTIALIDSKKLDKNFSYLTKNIKKNSKIIMIIKANAYGHGAIEVAKKFDKKIDYFGVANLQEAIELKEAKIKKNILILGSISNEEITDSIKKNIIFTVYDLSQLKFINKLPFKRIKFHLKIDTGMNRLGVSINEIDKILKIINMNTKLNMEGVYTHLAEADIKKSSFTKKQISLFHEIVIKIQKSVNRIDFIHIANSSGILNHNIDFCNTTRPGLMLYGLGTNKNLNPVMTLKTKIIKLRDLKPGESVSYGRTFIAKSKKKIAIVPIGYADGLPRSLSNKGYLFCKGNKCKILGRVCMDLTMIDVTNVLSPKIGDDVIIFGDKYQSAMDIGKSAKTIAYDIVCGISKRVTRLYK